MGWDGNGVMSRTNGTNTGAETWQDDAAAATKIRADRHDTHDQDLSDAIGACLTKNNESKPTADFLPNVDASYDLGSASARWADIHYSGSIIGPAAVSNYIAFTGGQIWAGSGKSRQTISLSQMAANTYETVGATGSGATNIWTAMDDLPSSAVAIIVHVELNYTANSSNACFCAFYAADGDESSPDNTSNYLRAYSRNKGASSDNFVETSELVIPLGPTNQDFKATWNSSSTSAANAILDLQGFYTA